MPLKMAVAQSSLSMRSHMINLCEHKVSIAYHLEKQDYSPKNNTKNKEKKWSMMR